MPRNQYWQLGITVRSMSHVTAVTKRTVVIVSMQSSLIIINIVFSAFFLLFSHQCKTPMLQVSIRTTADLFYMKVNETPRHRMKGE